jgi:hypothetical protein
MERSEIRGLSIRFNAAPGLRCAPSGLRRKKEAERRQTRVRLPHPSMRLPPPNVPRFWREARRGARLSASHHGSRQRESSSLRLSSRPCFLGRGLNGCYPPSPVPAQGNTPRPGHSAGGLMPEAARGRSVWPRPQAPHSPQPPESTLPDGVLGERDSVGNVTEKETNVTSRLRYRDGVPFPSWPDSLRPSTSLDERHRSSRALFDKSGK